MHFSPPITALLALPAVLALVQKEGVVKIFMIWIVETMLKAIQGKLPALGWNSWNAFGCDVNETKIMTAANEVVNLGLKDAGYEYINSPFHPFSSLSKFRH